MSPLLSNRSQLLIAFLASLVVGLRAGRTDDGSSKVRLSVLSNLAGTAGLLVGFALASRTKRQE